MYILVSFIIYVDGAEDMPVPPKFKIQMLNRNFSLKLLSTLTVVCSIIEKMDVDQPEEIVNNLPIPQSLIHYVLDKYFYQIDTYFTSHVEPMIKYNYPNE